VGGEVATCNKDSGLRHSTMDEATGERFFFEKAEASKDL
jgi:hypothetical protein